MIVLRFFLGFLLLWLAGLGTAYLVTRNRRYLRLAWLSVQIGLLLAVGFMLVYLLQRVLLVL